MAADQATQISSRSAFREAIANLNPQIVGILPSAPKASEAAEAALRVFSPRCTVTSRSEMSRVIGGIMVLLVALLKSRAPLRASQARSVSSEVPLGLHCLHPSC